MHNNNRIIEKSFPHSSAFNKKYQTFNVYVLYIKSCFGKTVSTNLENDKIYFLWLLLILLKHEMKHSVGNYEVDGGFLFVQNRYDWNVILHTCSLAPEICVKSSF